MEEQRRYGLIREREGFVLRSLPKRWPLPESKMAGTGKTFRPTDPEYRFETVAYLQQIWWLEIEGEVEFQLPRGTYTLFFRLHLGKPCRRRMLVRRAWTEDSVEDEVGECGMMGELLRRKHSNRPMDEGQIWFESD